MRLLSEVVAGRFRQFNPLISCRPVSSPGRLKKGAFDETLSREPVSGPKPQPNRPVLLSHKTVYHTPIYGSQKEDGSTQPGPSWQGGRNHDQVLGVCTGRRMAQPETDRRPLRLRAMPPGRLRRKRRNPHHAGRHNNRAGPCGRVRRLRGAVVGGTGGPSPRVRGENVNSASPGSARSRPGREAAERTLDGADRFGIIRNEGKGDNSKGSQTGGDAAPSHIERGLDYGSSRKPSTRQHPPASSRFTSLPHSPSSSAT